MTCPIPGMEVATSALRDNAPSAAKSRAISARNVVFSPSIWLNRFLFGRLRSVWRSCFWRLSAAVRSFTSASRAVPSSSSTCPVRGPAATRAPRPFWPPPAHPPRRSWLPAPSVALASRACAIAAAWPPATPRMRGAMPVDSYTTQPTRGPIRAASASNPRA